MLAAVTIAGVLALVLVLLLLIPIGLEVQIDEDGSDPAARSKLRLSWLGGLVAFDLPLRSRALRGEGPPPRRSSATGAAAGSPAGGAPARMLRLLQSEGFLAGVVRLLRRLLRALHPRQVRVSLVLGLEDPADTGQLWAALGPLSAILWSASGGALVLEPDFCRPRAAIAVEGRFRMIPAQLIGLLLPFALSPTMLRAARNASRA